MVEVTGRSATLGPIQDGRVEAAGRTGGGEGAGGASLAGEALRTVSIVGCTDLCNCCANRLGAEDMLAARLVGGGADADADAGGGGVGVCDRLLRDSKEALMSATLLRSLNIGQLKPVTLRCGSR